MFYVVFAVAALGYLGICAALFFMQRSLIYFPSQREVTAPESTMRLAVDGAQLVVSVRPHVGPKAIIYFGGNAEDVSGQLRDFSTWFPEYALYLLHYRGYGGSTGAPTQDALFRDARALLTRVQVEHPETVLIGRSLGTGVAVHLASEVPVAGLLLVTPFDSLADPAAAQYPFLPVRWLLRDRYDSGSYAPGIRCPTTILIAEADEVIPRSSTERLAGRFGKGVATTVLISAAGHNSIGKSPEYRTALVSALAKSARAPPCARLFTAARHPLCCGCRRAPRGRVSVGDQSGGASCAAA